MDPIYDVSVFGKVIKQRRKALGYTQAQVANLCGTGIRFISDLENGKPTIELGKAITVASALCIDLVPQVRVGP
ncbi:MAG: transcriptional regulator [Candidatus Melainabacteria bacterium HGW-Melainabacteria-1]|nr:MAG: transcriptional regulator [Candidatus Melainabacteria bacterium HGW-Melainabacteria-1]